MNLPTLAEEMREQRKIHRRITVFIWVIWLAFALLLLSLYLPVILYN